MTNALAKVRTDRAAAERRIAALENRRAKQLVASDDISVVDQIDTAIETERRAIRILDQRLVALARADRQQARKDREADRTAALTVIGPMLDQRTAWASELQEALKRVVGLHDQIRNEKELHRAWPFNLPEYFSFVPSDLGMQILRTLRDCPGGYEMLPAQVRAQLSQGGGGVTQVFAGSRGPDDLPSTLAANAAHILSVLGKMQIHPPEPADDDDNVNKLVEAAE